MKLARAIQVSALVGAVSGCGDSSPPPNHSVRGKVTAVTRVSPGCTMPKILHLFFGCGDPSYRVEIAAPRPVRVHIDATKVAEDDMRRVIDQDVVMGCYRAADERGMECSKWATSIVFQGRELAK